MSTNKIINEQELAEQFKLPPRQVLPILEQAGVQPIYTMPQGKGHIRLYDADTATAAMTTHLQKPAADTSTPDSKRTLETVLGLASIVEDGIEQVQAATVRLTDQNRALLKAIEEAKVTTAEALADIKQQLQTISTMTENLGVMQAMPVINVVNTPAEPAPVPKSGKKLPRVVIAGLLGHQVTVVKREYEELFDLRFAGSDESKGRDFIAALNGCDALFTMTSFVSHTVENAAKSSGVRIFRVTGGMTALKDKLTGYYVECADKVKEPA